MGKRTIKLSILCVFSLCMLLYAKDSLEYVNCAKDGENGVDGLKEAISVTVSPDNKHVYTVANADDAVSFFARDIGTGALTYVGSLEDGSGGVDGLNNVKDVTISPDGNHVYTVGGYGEDAVSFFSRNSETGVLTYVGFLKDGVDSVDGLQGAWSVAVSPDGNHVYVAASNDNAISYFSRNSTTGELTYIDCVIDEQGGVNGLAAAYGVTVSPDGNHVYAAGHNDNAVACFSRDSSTGALTYIDCIIDGAGDVDGLKYANTVTVSPDGKHVYVAADGDNAIACFSRNSGTGTLTYIGFLKDGVDSVDGLGKASSVTVSPSGNLVYAAASSDDAVSFFKRNTETGVLTFLGCIKDSDTNVDGLNSASAVAASPDGNHVYATSQFDHAVTWFTVFEDPTSIENDNIFHSSLFLNISPNPFNLTTSIHINLLNKNVVSLKIYDVKGREVAVLLENWEMSGFKRVNFNNRDLTSGEYFCELKTEKELLIRRLLLIK